MHALGLARAGRAEITDQDQFAAVLEVRPQDSSGFFASISWTSTKLEPLRPTGGLHRHVHVLGGRMRLVGQNT